MLANLKQRNVVQLLGFCMYGGWFGFGKGLYVCNEFFSVGSLDKYISASTNNPQVPLKWAIRYKIIRGICIGLEYLHEQCNKTVAHLDLKPSNILLDKEMVPKIADFGLSRAFVITKTHTYTAAAMGTNGYMAPELTERKEKGSRVGKKCDIYSLGVLILAIVMGEGPTATSDPNGVTFIRKIRERTEKRMKEPSADENRKQLKRDASLGDDDCLEDVEKCIDLAFKCVEKEPEKRPSATDICGRLLPPVPSTDTTRDHVALEVGDQQEEFVEGLDELHLLSSGEE
ncbi:Cysteine-rich receptor-like protein kinase 14 [Dichanthelium oligosanthes]|uniref:non-specific serine/threonine protein kinase n=1 Tax=Dichanthelium oligosanthes TaxID=888268 RepID=A0A1E5UUN3_9POAL|nr:Cysteine-rich receptor-like protein kinase 14 [Dichanthelium oligosanthes]